VRSLAEGTITLESSVPADAIALACQRGIFRPEEEQLFRWFGHLLTLRDALWEVVAELSESLGSDSLAGSLSLQFEENPGDDQRRRFFVGYAAACLLVRIDRLLVEDVATNTLAQRKLNEGRTERRIPRKQFTAIFESLSLPRNALLMRSAMRLAEREQSWLTGLDEDPDLKALISRLAWLEAPLDASVSRYLGQLLDYGDHALRRLAASSAQQATFSVLESSGRMVGELRDHWGDKRVDASTLRSLRDHLRPGDVFATRHDVQRQLKLDTKLPHG
jgi:hypothetical protein